jgi:hypothetical protein
MSEHTHPSPEKVVSYCETCKMRSLGPLCLNSLCSVGNSNREAAVQAVADGTAPDPRLHGEGRCVPAVPSPTESVVTEEMLRAALGAMVPLGSAPDPCTYAEYEYRKQRGPWMGTCYLDATQMRAVLEAAFGARSRAAAPPECRHVVKSAEECDHGTNPPYTSICSGCGPDYGCEHAGIRSRAAALEQASPEDDERAEMIESGELSPVLEAFRARSQASPPALTLAQIEAAVNETIIPSERKHFLRHVRAVLGVEGDGR